MSATPPLQLGPRRRHRLRPGCLLGSHGRPDLRDILRPPLQRPHRHGHQLRLRSAHRPTPSHSAAVPPAAAPVPCPRNIRPPEPSIYHGASMRHQIPGLAAATSTERSAANVATKPYIVFTELRIADAFTFAHNL